MSALATHAWAASAVASIPGHADDVNAIVWSQLSVKEAEFRAMTHCREIAASKGIKGRCRIETSATGPGYVSLVYGDHSTGYATAGSKSAAEQLAYETCRKHSSDCTQVDTWYDRIGGDPHAGRVPSGPYRSSCENDDCVIKFQNSTDIFHVQAYTCMSPHLDGSPGVTLSYSFDGSCN